MGLLIIEHDQDFARFSDNFFAMQNKQENPLYKGLGDQERQKLRQGLKYYVDFMYIALRLEDYEIFSNYARWVYQLLCPIMPDSEDEEIRDILLANYELIRNCAKENDSEAFRAKLGEILDHAIEATTKEHELSSLRENEVSAYEDQTVLYLNTMLRADNAGCMNLIAKFIKDEIPISDICVDIVTEAMRRVGDLWQKNEISVDVEHYCTSITQMALSQLYPLIFGSERKDKSILVACVGSELHELGARMIADLFEYNGWDSIYLGAAVPVASMASAAVRHKPDLVALSVTMPHHLLLCRDAVVALRQVAPDIRIAVGGNAFVH